MADTHGMTPAQVLAALYNASSPYEGSPGWLHYVPGDMPMAEAEEHAAEWVKPGFHYDYIRGRPVKVPNFQTVTEGSVDTERYDTSFNRPGKGQEALDYFHRRLQASGGKWPVGL